MKRIRLAPNLVFWALAALTLLASHDAVWLVQLGPGERLAAALRASQHGYWAIASVAVLVVAVAVAATMASRSVSLVRRARALGVSATEVHGSGFPARAAVAWVRLLAIVGIGFAIQENVEHYLAHGHVLGLGAITGPEYPLAVPVLAAVTGLAALLAAAVRTVHAELAAGIAAALDRLRLRAPRRARLSPDRVLLPRRPALATSDAGRAPPLLPVGT